MTKEELALFEPFQLVCVICTNKLKETYCVNIEITTTLFLEK